MRRRRQWHPTPVLLPGKSQGQEPGRLQSMGSLRVGHDWATSLSLFTFMHWRRKQQPTPVFLPGESQGLGAWWAAVYGVAQSRARLKWLSSSSRYDLGIEPIPLALEAWCPNHEEGNGNPLQYSCLENPMDGGAWCRLLSMGSQRVWAWLSDFTFTLLKWACDWLIFRINELSLGLQKLLHWDELSIDWT